MSTPSVSYLVDTGDYKVLMTYIFNALRRQLGGDRILSADKLRSNNERKSTMADKERDDFKVLFAKTVLDHQRIFSGQISVSDSSKRPISNEDRTKISKALSEANLKFSIFRKP